MLREKDSHAARIISNEFKREKSKKIFDIIEDLGSLATSSSLAERIPNSVRK